MLESGDPATISHALLSLALHDSDWRFVQGLCLLHAGNSDVWVRRNCATALAHIARLHQVLDLETVLPVLDRLEGDPEVTSWAEAAKDDIEIFIMRNGH